MNVYPRFVTSVFIPFNPIELAKQTEKMVCENNKRKYTTIYCTGVYGGIATAYTVGCCLRCVYCWVSLSRDFPEKYGKFYSPEEVVKNLEEAARKYGTYKARISGGEPSLGKEHLIAILELIEKNEWLKLFILETNGILFGADKDYVQKLSKFTKVHVRLCLKAASEEGFQKRTGAIGRFYTIPFDGIRNLLDFGVSFHVAAMTDPRIMPTEERKVLIEKLEEIDKRIVANLEEETIGPYNTTLFRLEKAGIKLEW